MENPLPSVYFETSIVSYLSARESSSLLGAAHQLVNRRWWDRRNLYRCFVSESVSENVGQVTRLPPFVD